MFQNGFYVFTTHPWEPFEKIIHGSPSFQIFEQGHNRNPRAFEKPCATNLSGHSFDYRTLAPIQHDHILPCRLSRSKMQTTDTNDLADGEEDAGCEGAARLQ